MRPIDADLIEKYKNNTISPRELWLLCMIIQAKKYGFLKDEGKEDETD